MNVFACSNAGIMGSNPTQDMDVCARLFCVCVFLCVGSGLATGWSPVQGVLPIVYSIKELKKAAKVQQKDCRLLDIYFCPVVTMLVSVFHVVYGRWCHLPGFVVMLCYVMSDARVRCVITSFIIYVSSWIPCSYFVVRCGLCPRYLHDDFCGTKYVAMHREPRLKVKVKLSL
jgi:hypothetical protein